MLKTEEKKEQRLVEIISVALTMWSTVYQGSKRSVLLLQHLYDIWASLYYYICCNLY